MCVPLPVRALRALLATCLVLAPSPFVRAEALDLEPAPIAEPIQDFTVVEDLSEESANRLIDFSYAVQKRNFEGALAYLSEDFLGQGFGELGPGMAQRLAAGAESTLHDRLPPERIALGREPFVDAIAALVSPLESLEFVFLKTRGAEFEPAPSGREQEIARGLVRLTFHVIGRKPGNAPVSIHCWAHGEVRRHDRGWCLRRFILDKMQVTERRAPCFVDVASSAAVAHALPPLRAQKSTSFYWRGAATGDVDGDGRDDIFASSAERNFLYRNRGNGTFEDITRRAGLMEPPGVTGPLFFDYDNDGDPDLFCAYVGWESDGVPAGWSLRLYRNDGECVFQDVSRAAGIAGRHIAFSAAAADIDNDGWLDLYVCCYNRLDALYPDSWHRATNGKPNLLFRNRQDGTFEEIAAHAGVAGTDWSYAASFADFDEDGDQDLHVANDYGDKNLYRNRGDGTFEDVAAQFGVLDTGNGMGSAWGDLDNDGRLDLYVSNMASSAGNRILNRLLKKDESRIGDRLFKLAAGNSIFRQGNACFTLLPPSAGGIGASWAWGVTLQDFDLDGFLDIYVANGFISGESLKDT